MAGAAAAFPSPPILLKSRPSPPKLPSLNLKSPKLPFVNTDLASRPKIIYPHSNLQGGLEEGVGEIEEAYSADEAEIDDDDDDSDEESSIDLLFRFLQNMFRKASKQAKKATRSVLPPVISTQLVVCNLGATVFAVILLLRFVWAMLSHFQPGGNNLSGGGTYSMPAA